MPVDAVALHHSHDSSWRERENDAHREHENDAHREHENDAHNDAHDENGTITNEEPD